MSDVHGEYEAFSHVLKNGSGAVRKKIDDVFGETLNNSDKSALSIIKLSIPYLSVLYFIILIHHLIYFLFKSAACIHTFHYAFFNYFLIIGSLA